MSMAVVLLEEILSLPLLGKRVLLKRTSNNNFVYHGVGLRVTIDCKPENGHFKTRGVGKLDEVKDGKLNEECYAQLHSASAAPCPTHNGLESSKVVFKSKAKGKYTFGLEFLLFNQSVYFNGIFVM
ncbi:proline-rich protein 4 [Quercus suber]|uniref:Proline-rich protein 4 n=1 Tax=Quercus suber TaxID=58331 RepID=A0AAW0K6A2_QUESU